MGENKISKLNWFNICMFGLSGIIAWNMENMYYNTFMYNTVYEGGNAVGNLSSMTAIQLMVSLSAITAFLATIFIGNLSDKLNKRKVILSTGFIIWGIICAGFGFLTKANVSAVFGITEPVKLVTVTAIVIIIMDCVMTFVGSSSYDAVFNAWVTDITSPRNRATVESVLAIFSVAAVVVVVAVGGMIELLGGYQNFFLILGLFVLLCGIISVFTLKDSRSGVIQKDEHYWENLISGFRPSVIKQNPKLYITFLAAGLYNISIQCFFPYLLIYLDHGLGLKIENLISYLSLPVIGGLVVAAAVIVVAVIFMGKIIDKVGKNVAIFIAFGLYVLGLFGAGAVHTLGKFAIVAVPLLAGYGLLGIILNSTVRDYTPEDNAGMFQGIRMIFYVLIPMVLGPAIGDYVCAHAASGTYLSDTGVATYEPCAAMFTAAAVVGVLILIPILILFKKGINKEVSTDL